MYLTGFADEASQDLMCQIEATKELGWNAIEARSIEGTNIHDLDEKSFNNACESFAAADIQINCFGSTIGNWSKRIEDPFEITLAEISRTIPRMHLLDVKLIRIMSYARCAGEDQIKEERFRRLREITNRFLDAGITPVHENCMNYGGMSWSHSLELIENVPGLKLVFDTGNPVVSQDFSKKVYHRQCSLEFFNKIKKYVVYVHIKDARLEKGKEIFVNPGEGDAKIPEILQNLKDSDYRGGISIEPHMASVFHDPTINTISTKESYKTYVNYGFQLMKLLSKIEFSPIHYSNN
jgi:sugar phosphate isomerase/epimerase